MRINETLSIVCLEHLWHCVIPWVANLAEEKSLCFQRDLRYGDFGYHILLKIKSGNFLTKPITVAAPFKEWAVFVPSNTGIVGSNPTQGMAACWRLFRVCVVLCVCSGFAMGWSPVQGVRPTVYSITKLKKLTGPNQELWSHWWMDG
jgi:hypothetical protein